MKKYIYTLMILVAFILTGCSADSTKTEIVAHKNIFNITKVGESETLENLYTLNAEKENQELNKISDSVYSNYYYLDETEELYYVNRENEFYVNKDGSATKIASDVGEFQVAYINGKKYIAFCVGIEKELYLKVDDSEKERIDSNIGYFVLGNNGTILYLNDEAEIYLKKIDSEKEKVSSEAEQFRTNYDMSMIAYRTLEQKFYCYNVANSEKERLDEEAVANVAVYNGGLLTYLSDYDYLDGRGELYIKIVDEDKKKIASDVVDYMFANDTAYYINKEGNFYAKKISDDSSTKIAANVKQFKINGNEVYYETEENIVFKFNSKDDSLKKATDVYDWDIQNNHIVWLSNENNLYIDDEKVASDIMEFKINGLDLAYVNKDVDLYLKKNEADAIKLDYNKEDLFNIYYGNELLYTNNMRLSDITGLWYGQAEDDAYMDTFLEITNGKLIIHYDAEYQEEYKIDVESADFSNIYLNIPDIEGSIGISKENDDEIRIYDNEEIDDDELTLSRATTEEMNERFKAREEEIKAEEERIRAEEERARAEEEKQRKLEEAENLAYDILYTYLYVDTEKANCRDMPSLNSNIVGTLERGTSLYVEDYSIDDEYRIWVQTSMYDDNYDYITFWVSYNTLF